MSTLGKLTLGTAATALSAITGLALFTAWNGRRAERLVPADGHFLQVDGATLHYADIGSGPPIVMIHGLGGQLRNFTYALSETLAQDHRLIIVDRPGSGYSTFGAETKERGLFAQARVIVELITALGLERPLLVGHSLGGAVALAAAVQYPERVGGLALLAPLTQPIETVPDVFKALALQSPAARAAIAWTLAAPLSRARPEAGQEQVFGPEAVPDDFEVRGGAALTLRPAAFQAAAADVEACRVEMPILARRYGELKLPVGILFAKEDRSLDFADHGPPTAQAIAGAELTAIAGGHMFPLTQPALTGDWIRARVAAGRR